MFTVRKILVIITRKCNKNRCLDIFLLSKIIEEAENRESRQNFKPKNND